MRFVFVSFFVLFKVLIFEGIEVWGSGVYTVSLEVVVFFGVVWGRGL